MHRRLWVILVCIVDGAGGNELVEKKRGKLFRDATIVDLTGDKDEEPSQPAATQNNPIAVDLGMSDVDDDESIVSLED